ncbi:uncharacterized protein LOC134405660 [Elgaria multicarinata webbii]|uniref:uncharacterized protein LOC134405660 n=1 Tax=Elgaria multicarinata webbii TaxID=159646 RepID=UPI002FCCC173
MSIILSGLIHVFRPLLSSLSGALDCKGVGPWYFLLGLRIVAIFFSNGPWDLTREYIECNLPEDIGERSRDFCWALCQNEHFPISISAMWGLEFIVLLLLIGLMRLTSPKKKKKGDEKEKEDSDKGLVIVESLPHGGVADMSTIYTVGRDGLPSSYTHHHDPSTHPHHRPHPHYADWHDWHSWDGRRVPHMAGGYGTDAGVGPYEVGRHGMPSQPEPMGQTKMPVNCYDMGQHKTSVCSTDLRPSKMSAHSSGADQYGLSPFQSHTKQTNARPYCGETEQYNEPTRCPPVPMGSSPYKGQMGPQCWPADEHNEAFLPRYIDPEECGGVESTDHVYMMGTRVRYTGQSKMPPRYCEDGRHSMEAKCKAAAEAGRGRITLHPRMDGQANMAIKRRPVQGNKMHPKRHVVFDASSRPMASNCRPIGRKNIMAGPGLAPGPTLCCHGNAACTCAETHDPCHNVGPQHEPQNEPCCCTEPTHNRHRGSPPGPQEEAKMSITKICGVPLFDVWVGLLLALEICFLCYVILFMMPRLLGLTWLCIGGIGRCPLSIECTVKERAEKRVALWSLVFTSILFIIACSGYFNLRFCWNRRCRQMCNEEEERREEEEMESEARVFRGDAEGGNDGSHSPGL